MFGDEIASRMLRFTHHKITAAITMTLAVIWRIFLVFFGHNYVYYLGKLIIFCYLFIYTILVSLCINKTIFISSIKHFVFWFKTVASIELAVSYFILRYIMIKDREATCINIFGDIFSQLTAVLSIINFSAIDGHQMRKCIKIACVITFSILYTSYAVNASLLYDQYERSMVVLGPFQVSIASLNAGAFRALSIFLWKQTILMMLKGDRCVNIRHSPKIKWVENDTN